MYVNIITLNFNYLMLSNNEVSPLKSIKSESEYINHNKIITEEIDDEDEYIENIKTHLNALNEKFEFMNQVNEELKQKTQIFVYENTPEAIDKLYNEK